MWIFRLLNLHTIQKKKMVWTVFLNTEIQQPVFSFIFALREHCKHFSNGKPNSFEGETKARSRKSEKEIKSKKHFYVYYIQPLHIVWITDVRAHASRALGIGNNKECLLHRRLHIIWKDLKKKSDWAAKHTIHWR